ncbi:MAG TPA: HNH endonuclease, partial [bacterium]|nr:HNH endonuclease [bacterium]
TQWAERSIGAGPDAVFQLKVRGGKDAWENLVTACITCNNKKGDRTPDEARMVLMTTPRRPHPLSFIQGHASGHYDNWKQYLFMS